MVTLEYIPVPIKYSPTEVDVLTINKNASPYITQVAQPVKETNSQVVPANESSNIPKVIGIVALAGLLIYAIRSYGK